MAVRKGDEEKVRNLLESGANANEVDDNGDNALHWAVFCGHTDLCEVLLQRGADWRRRTGRAGYTVLHDAAWDGLVQYSNYTNCISDPHSSPSLPF